MILYNENDNRFKKLNTYDLDLVYGIVCSQTGRREGNIAKIDEKRFIENISDKSRHYNDFFTKKITKRIEELVYGRDNIMNGIRNFFDRVEKKRNYFNCDVAIVDNFKISEGEAGYVIGSDITFAETENKEAGEKLSYRPMKLE